MSPRLDRLLLAAVLLVAACVFLAGITWGLPSRAADPYLFGDRTPWTGAQVLAASERAAIRDDPNRGADVDADPLSAPDRVAHLNRDDGDRAQIVRRYRLFSHQPDEMITFMALGQMKPGQLDLDPRLYQYGGAWVYPVGLLLRAGASVGLIELRGGDAGKAFYLDHPEHFARFYVVARTYSAAWGLVAVWAVFAIVKQITGRSWVAALAGVAFAYMPVVITMAHEAKPHLPGTALILLAVLAAARYVESGRLSHALAAGALCGLAFGMVLSAAPVFAILPAMVLLRPMSWGDRARVAVFCGLLGLTVYGLTNPYVVVHLLRGGGPLKSNLGNLSAAFPRGPIGEGVVSVGRLVGVGMTTPLAACGLLAAVVLGIRAWRVRKDESPDAVRRRAHGLLLAIPAVLAAIQAVPTAAGRPAEFARFLLPVDAFLVVEAFAYLGTAGVGMAVARTRVYMAGGLVAATAVFAMPYAKAFVRDAGPATSRLVAAEELASRRPPERERFPVDDWLSAAAIRQTAFVPPDGGRLLLPAEPAPYNTPPFDLWRWRVFRVPPAIPFVPAPDDVRVTVEEGDAPAAFADKSFAIEPARGE